MVGHKWEKVIARVAGVQLGGAGDAVPAPGSGPIMAAEAYREYVVDIRKPDGQDLRATVRDIGGMVYPVGWPVHVEVNFKSGEARLNSHATKKLALEMMRDRPSAAAGAGGVVNVADQIRMQAAEMAGGAAGGWQTGPGGALGAAMGDASMHVVHLGGQQIWLTASQQAEVRALTSAVLSGDPVARQAAKERFQQLKAEFAEQAGAGFTAPGSTFGPIGGTFEPPAAFGPPTAAQPFAAFDPPIASGSPAAFGAQNAFDSFGAGQSTAEERLTKLKQLFDKGILTESEYQAKRQEIINGL